MTPVLPLRVGSYDDGGQVVDHEGNELFTFGCDDDTRQMNERQASLSRWVISRLNNADRLLREVDAYEKAFRAIADILNEHGVTQPGVRKVPE